MTPEQTQNYINASLAFLNRVQLTGQEAETLVEIKRWLVSLANPVKPLQELLKDA